MPPIPTRPRKRRAQGGLTRSGAYPPASVFSTRRPGVATPRLGARQDHAPGVEEDARSGSTRRSAVTPTPTATRQGGHTSGHDLGALLRKMAHPTQKKKKRRTRRL